MKQKILLFFLVFSLFLLLFNIQTITTVQSRKDFVKNVDYDNSSKITVPILMYHDFDYSTDFMTVSPDNFKAHLKIIDDLGYNTISYNDLIGYKYSKKDLPKKPILITFDDGYWGNYEYAYPALKEKDMLANINIVVSSIRNDNIKYDKQYNDKFTWSQTKEMLESGNIELGIHTYDMHGIANYAYNKNQGASSRFEREFLYSKEFSYAQRHGVSKIPNEGNLDYIKVLYEDFSKAKSVINEKLGLELEVNTFAYPYGLGNETTDLVLRKLGYRLSLTINHGTNKINRSSSLENLNRANVSGEINDAQFRKLLLSLN